MRRVRNSGELSGEVGLICFCHATHLYLSTAFVSSIGTRDRSLYKYPSTRSESPSPSHPPSLAVRLRLLQAEIASLETELSDPSNSTVQTEEGHVDPGELIQSLVDVKSRLEKFNTKQDGRSKLVKEVLKEEPAKDEDKEGEVNDSARKEGDDEAKSKSEVQDLAAIDRRLGEIEKLVGSASTSIDEVRLSAMIIPVFMVLIQNIRHHLCPHLFFPSSRDSTPNSPS